MEKVCEKDIKKRWTIFWGIIFGVVGVFTIAHIFLYEMPIILPHGLITILLIIALINSFQIKDKKIRKGFLISMIFFWSAQILMLTDTFLFNVMTNMHVKALGASLFFLGAMSILYGLGGKKCKY